MKRNDVVGQRLALCLVAVLGLAACAGTAGSVRPISPASPAVLEQYDNLFVEAVAGPAAPILPPDLARIERLIGIKIQEHEPRRFAAIRLASSGQTKPASHTRAIDTGAEASKDREPAVLEAVVTIDTYQRGSGGSRFMGAGAGQIRINGSVGLVGSPEGGSMGKYRVEKTFAWGGIYGATTDITDVEHGFAEAVAAIILGEDEAKN